MVIEETTLVVFAFLFHLEKFGSLKSFWKQNQHE